MFAIDDFGSPSRRASSLGPAATPPFSASRSRITAARVTAGASESASPMAPAASGDDRDRRIGDLVLRARHPVPLALPVSMLNRVPYLDCYRVRCHNVQPTAVCPICWTGADECKRRVPRGVAVPFGRGSDHSDLHRLSLFRRDPIRLRPRRSPARSRQPRPAPSPRQRIGRRARTSPASTVNLLTFNGPQIAEPLQRRAPDFEALTGAKINVVAVGFQEIYDKAILDLSTGTNSFDAFVFNPQWLGDFTGPGYLEDLTARVDERSRRRLAGRRAVLPRLQRDVRRARSTRSRSTATSTWSITAAT